LTKTRSKKSLPTKFNSSYQRDNQGKKSSPSEDKQKWVGTSDEEIDDEEIDEIIK
jgi:hypothetical protein